MPRRLLHRLLMLLALLAVATGGFVLVRSWGDTAPQPPFRMAQALASFRESGVEVALTLERDHADHAILAGTFTPLESGSHVYSIDLPQAGIDGAGRPTRLDIPLGQIVSAAGRVLADQPVELRVFDGFSSAFPVYPDGAVTLRLPIVGLHDSGVADVRVSVSYMACSSRGYCLPPVENRLVTIHLRAGG